MIKIVVGVPRGQITPLVPGQILNELGNRTKESEDDNYYLLLVTDKKKCIGRRSLHLQK